MVIPMETNQRKVFLETKLRNLKRKNAKLAQHADLADQYFEIDKEIKSIEKELNS